MKLFQFLAIATAWGVLASSVPTKGDEAAGDELTEDLIQSTVDEVREILKNDETNETMESLSRQMEALIERSERLMTHRADVAAKQKEVDNLFVSVNALQVENLVDRLKEFSRKDAEAREAQISAQQAVDSGIAAPVFDESKYVSATELKERFEIQQFMQDSEAILRDWVIKMIDEELAAYKTEVLEKASSRVESQNSDDCPHVTDVAQDVQTALVKFSQDGTGLVDHAQGAGIVHSMTSSTYSPPPENYELLGNVWWRKYIPQDWERMLPNGWENWSTAIPSYVYHSLNLRGAKTSPPEAILQAKTLPGACWPMEGHSGQVTIRLSYPVKVESFTVDHAPWEILPPEMQDTAPKKIRVFGYPPCPAGGSCSALGFDDQDPMEIGRIDLEMGGPTIQTFDSIFVQTSSEPPPLDDAEKGLEDEEYDEGSCSAEAAACTSPPKIDIAAITLLITENWGNPDYTCLYRFRLHGEEAY